MRAANSGFPPSHAQNVYLEELVQYRDVQWHVYKPPAAVTTNQVAGGPSGS